MTHHVRPNTPTDSQHSPGQLPAGELDDDAVAALARRYVMPFAPEDERACEHLVESLGELSRSMCETAGTQKNGTDVDELPEQIGQYRILEPIGRGGMGHVYRALHVYMNREVALKILPGDRRTREAVERFHREMQLNAELAHPNVVEVTDANHCDGVSFLVMELLDGLNLREVVRRLGPLSPADGCAVAVQAAHGLQAIHDRAIVHRDVTPSNLMLTAEGKVKILDLGLGVRLAAAPSDDEELTANCRTMGTLPYMAPEQREDSHNVDARADIYALGATLACLLAGRTPRPEAAAEQLPHDLPSGLLASVRRMLAFAPEDRFPSAAAAAEALSPFAAGSNLAALVSRARNASKPPPEAAPAPGMPRRRERRLRRRLGVLLSGVLFLGGLAAALVLTLQTPDGTLRIQTEDAAMRVAVVQQGRTVAVIDAATGWEVSLPDGSYEVRVVEPSSGTLVYRLTRDRIQVAPGDRLVLLAERTPPPVRRTLVAACLDGPWVRLVNRMSYFCLAPLDGSARERASIHQYLLAPGDPAQHWRIESTEGSLCRLKNRKSGLYLTLKRPVQDDGYLQQLLEPKSREFLFSIEDIDQRDVRIVSAETGYSMGIWGAAMREGEWAVQHPFEARATDRYWHIEPVPADEAVQPSAEIVPPIDALRAGEIRETWCDFLQVPPDFTNSQAMRLLLVPPGELLTASGERVIRRPFYAGVHEVTQGQYAAVTGEHPSEHRPAGDATRTVEDLPVERITWVQAVEFCNRLSTMDGLPPFYVLDGDEIHRDPKGGYRLLTEDEWLYAAAAGDLKGLRQQGESSWLSGTWCAANSSNVPHAVGQLQANALGFYDFWGNVWEYVDTPGSFRGECYGATTEHLNALRGFNNGLRNAAGDVGFRVAIDVDRVPADRRLQSPPTAEGP